MFDNVSGAFIIFAGIVSISEEVKKLIPLKGLFRYLKKLIDTIKVTVSIPLKELFRYLKKMIDTIKVTVSIPLKGLLL